MCTWDPPRRFRLLDSTGLERLTYLQVGRVGIERKRMPLTYSVTFDNGTRNCTIDRTPDICPICHTSIVPNEAGQVIATPDWLERVLRCPKQECQHLYIARYGNFSRPSPGSGGTYSYRFERVLPVTPSPSVQPETVVKLSPNFRETFQQAETAEQTGLDQISGVGYRKALEFLVKDYACHRNGSDSEKIKSMPLAQTIKDFISDNRIKEVAKRAVWLGNDETHYVRKWENKDIGDLKALIHLTVSWIDMEITTERLLAEMPDGKK